MCSRRAMLCAPLILHCEKLFLKFPVFALFASRLGVLGSELCVRMKRHIAGDKPDAALVVLQKRLYRRSDGSARFALGVQKLDDRHLRVLGPERSAVRPDKD